VGVQHAQQHNVEKEALCLVLGFCQSTLFKVGRHDAGVGARYQLPGVGSEMNVIHISMVGEEAGPPRPTLTETASHLSRSSRSLTARHQGLPGGVAFSGASTPRLTCQRVNDSAALRNGKCCGAQPMGPRHVRANSSRRPAGSSRTASTCLQAHAAAVGGALMADSPDFVPRLAKVRGRRHCLEPQLDSIKVNHQSG
jgi:hypothetical protein